MYTDPSMIHEIEARIADHSEVIAAEEARRDELENLLTFMKRENQRLVMDYEDKQKAASAGTPTTNK